MAQNLHTNSLNDGGGHSEEPNSFTLNSIEERPAPNVAKSVPLYRPHGRWEWVTGQKLNSTDMGKTLGRGLEARVIMKMGFVEGREIIYISKLTSVWDSLDMLFSNIYLHASSKYLRPLQGDCVPFIINVTHCIGGCYGFNQELPHPKGWREADMFLKEEQKEAIIVAYEKLHERKVLHGDAELRHMLIGNDERVTLIDFGLSKVVCPDEEARKARVNPCSPIELEREMRKVKFLLDYKNSREIEFQRANNKGPGWRPSRIVENEAFPIDEVQTWANGGKKWIAHRYEVVKEGTTVGFDKFPIIHPTDDSDSEEEEEEETSSKQKVDKGKGKMIEDATSVVNSGANTAAISKSITHSPPTDVIDTGKALTDAPQKPVVNEKRLLGIPQGLIRKREDDDSDVDADAASPKKRSKTNDQHATSSSSSTSVAAQDQLMATSLESSETHIASRVQNVASDSPSPVIGCPSSSKKRSFADSLQPVASTSKIPMDTQIESLPKRKSNDVPTVDVVHTGKPLTDAPKEPAVKEKRFLGIVFKDKIPQLGITNSQEDDEAAKSKQRKKMERSFSSGSASGTSSEISMEDLRILIDNSTRGAVLRYKNVARRYDNGKNPEVKDEMDMMREIMMPMLPLLPVHLREMMWEDMGKPPARKLLGLPPKERPSSRRTWDASATVNNSPAPLERTTSIHQLRPSKSEPLNPSGASLQRRTATMPVAGPSQPKPRPSSYPPSPPETSELVRKPDPRIAVLQQYGPQWAVGSEAGGTVAQRPKTGSRTSSASSSNSNAQTGPWSNANRARPTSGLTVPPTAIPASARPQTVVSSTNANRARPTSFLTVPPTAIPSSARPPTQLVSSNTLRLRGGQSNTVPPPLTAPTTSVKRKRDDVEDILLSAESSDREHPKAKKGRGDSSCSMM